MVTAFHPIPWVIGGALVLLLYDSGIAEHDLVLATLGLVALAIILLSAHKSGTFIQQIKGATQQ